MFINSFKGNETVRLSLEESIKSSKLSHAVLIFAKEGCGANYFAKLLAADIIGADADGLQLINSDANGQVQTVRGSGASGQIKVDSVRMINDNVNFSSIGGEKRVVIIENCENLNKSSANALLKNLEEPKDDITYILTALDGSAVLATIRSRCQSFTLSQPSIGQCKEYFADCTSEKKDELIKIYNGNIGMIKAALQTPQRLEILQKAIDARKFINSADWYALAKMMFSFNKKKEDFILFLKDTEYIFDSNFDACSAAVLNAVMEAKSALERNANLALVLENFIILIKNRL